MKTKIKNLSIKLCYPVEAIFNNIVNSITDVKTDEVKYPDAIFYLNNNKKVANYNSKSKHFWCNYDNFWLKFYLNNTFNYYVVNDLLNDMVEEHFKLKGVTTTYNHKQILIAGGRTLQIEGNYNKWINQCIIIEKNN